MLMNFKNFVMSVRLEITVTEKPMFEMLMNLKIFVMSVRIEIIVTYKPVLDKLMNFKKLHFRFA